MDVQMPEMDGLQATRRIRAPESKVKNRDVPIIAMTAHAMTGDRKRCLEAGMNDYVSKPVHPKELVAALERQLAASEKWDASLFPASSVASTQPPEIGKRPNFSSSAPSPAAVFDKRGLLNTLGGDEGTMREVLTLFLADIPQQMNTLEEAIHLGNAETATRQAHTLKGAAANVGATLLRECAAELEQLGGGHRSAAGRQEAASVSAAGQQEAASVLDVMAAGLEDLREQFAAVRAAVEKELSG
jgi:DNA-binding response OmpR family regulator